MTFKLDFVKQRNVYFAISIILILVSFVSLGTRGLNLGIDFVSGSRMDISIGGQPVNLDQARDVLEEIGYSDPNIRTAGTNQELLIFRIDQSLNKEQIDQISKKMESAFQQKVSIQEQVVDPIVGKELARNAFFAILLASIGILLYVSFRFEYRFAVAAVIAMFYDAILTVGFFSLFQIEVDLVFVAAILTIIGYSLNDTIVIFDRIRENLERDNPTRWEQLATLVNDSIGQTLVRSINTVLTILLAVVTLYLFGGESISNFSLALIVGIASGAYSSIFIASQVWIVWKWRSMQKKRSEPDAV